MLIESDLEEFSGLYSLLGDLIRPDEDLEDASYRVLRDRTGMDDVFLEQVATFGNQRKKVVRYTRYRIRECLCVCECVCVDENGIK